MDSGCPSLLRVAYHQALLASVSLLMKTRYALLDLMRQPSDAAIADLYPLGEPAFEFEAPDVHAAVGDTVDLLKLLPRAKLQLMRHRDLHERRHRCLGLRRRRSSVMLLLTRKFQAIRAKRVGWQRSRIAERLGSHHQAFNYRKTSTWNPSQSEDHRCRSSNGSYKC